MVVEDTRNIQRESDRLISTGVPDTPDKFYATLQDEYGIIVAEEERKIRHPVIWGLLIFACVILGVYSAYTHVHSVRKGAESVFFFSSILRWIAVVCGSAAHLKKITYNIKALEVVGAKFFYAPWANDVLSNLYPEYLRETAKKKMMSLRRIGASTLFAIFTMIPNIYKTEAKNDQLTGISAILVATAAEAVDLPESFISNVDGLEWIEAKRAAKNQDQQQLPEKLQRLSAYVEDQLNLFEKQVSDVDSELQCQAGESAVFVKNKMLFALTPVNLFVNMVFAYQAYMKLMNMRWLAMMLALVSELQDIYFKIAMPAGIVRTHRALPDTCTRSPLRYLRYFVYIFVSLFSFTGAYYDVNISIGLWTDSQWLIILAVANSLYNTFYDIYILRNTFDLAWERTSPDTKEKLVQLKVLEVFRKNLLYM